MNSQTSVVKEVEVMSQEKDEQERRKDNLLIVNIPENDKEDKDEKIAHDKKTVAEIIQKLVPDFKEEEILYPLRLGKKDDKFPRLIKITIKSSQTRVKIFQNITKLNDTETTPKERIYINKDLTPLQRTKEKTKRQEIFTLRAANPEKKYKWNRGEIVEIKND